MISLPIVILGLGNVGRALLKQIIDQRAHHEADFELVLNVRAVSDSRGFICTDQGAFSDQSLRDILALKESGQSLSAAGQGQAETDPLEVVRQCTVPGTVIVDCTATEATVPALLYGLEATHSIVLANKKPLTQAQDIYVRLTQAPSGSWRLNRCRWETTVGAGLPVITTLQRLIGSGDAIAQVQGTFSGTLGYVMTGLQAGQPLSRVVQEAHAQGYTEPDPRDDLGGLDVARKALILARGMGLQLEMEDVTVTGLYPPAMDALSISGFLDALSTLDADMGQQCREAAHRHQCLRYVASVTPEALTVGPQTVPLASPLGQLAGTDNLVQFSSHWYSPQPLVIQGRGAGVDATAAGVLSDIVELAFAQFR